jgi:glycosyltransferase A (GT-A) superfamily protein (DUF2064 family)
MFSKTPHISAVKTRIAKDFGDDFAIDLFSESIKVTLIDIKKLNIDYCVAVADRLDSLFWNDHPTILQPKGSLGERLSFIYKELRQSYDCIYFIGADAFHISYSNLKSKLVDFENSEFEHIMGKTHDGGFYLFGSKAEISADLWTSINYSSNSTSSELIKALNADIAELPVNFDLDTKDDLLKLSEISHSGLGLEQISLIKSISSKLV